MDPGGFFSVRIYNMPHLILKMANILTLNPKDWGEKHRQIFDYTRETY
jgi:hypothetical protein